MKKFPLILMAAIALVLAACSQPQEPTAAAGSWRGQVQSTGLSVPLSFEVDASGRINDGSFNASFNSEDFSWTVDAVVTDTTINVDARASHVSLGTVTFELDGTVSGDTMSGTWTLVASNDDGSFNASGSFELTRDTAE